MDRAHGRVAAGLAVALLACLAAAPAAARSPRITFYFGLERPEAKAQAAFTAVGKPVQTNPAALFDIVSGSNGYNPRVPGIDATPGYDMASGLGVPRFDQLAAALPPSAP